MSLAHQLGFPVLIKAAAGGGGRGMRVALNDLALKAAIQQAQAEAEAAFGNAEIYLEKYIEHPRHVEVQVIADNHGNVVHLSERDCTMQRRHQKLVEESPAPRLDPQTRTAICEAAVRLVRAAKYTNAGTVEFIVDPSGSFYFIEMNARIQVEHPVTEMVTGIDLIKAQILRGGRREAALPPGGRPPAGGGHRVPHQRRRPGEELPPHAGHDHAASAFPAGSASASIRTSTRATSSRPYYDSMIGKLIVHQPTRREAIACMKRALGELHIEGVKTTIPLHQKILDHTAFHEARVDTTFIERTWPT